ncbi:hypothetical protein GUJ93_ZPchr0013g36685 [Zizania palustris]|uniref:UspA domain-containing protein n=1 Tax=Zizania palustris TaxID=103762 RepID=A0A8J6C304_ZIZPA|nr:hypothetical protein GUJ93_ZPchr0013g36685 [Zizania palustris]
MEEKGVAATSGGPAAGAEASAGTMKVVVAVDASEESLHALAWALDNIVVRRAAGGCGGVSSLVVVHAQPGADHYVYPVAAHGIGAIAYAPAAAIESMRKAQDEISTKVVSRALDACKQREVNATGAILEGDAKEAICQAVEEMHADLLVLGSRGLGKIKRAFLGSVSDYLVHHACCPVLVVKPSKARDK